jgi:hypothetical protein
MQNAGLFGENAPNGVFAQIPHRRYFGDCEMAFFKRRCIWQNEISRSNHFVFL